MKWSNLNKRGKINYTLFVCNVFFMCLTVATSEFKMAAIHCAVAFLCWLATHAPNCYKQEDE